MRRIRAFGALVLAAGLITTGTARAGTAAPPIDDHVNVYTGDLTSAQIAAVRSTGLDDEDITRGTTAGGKTSVEVVMGGAQAQQVRDLGITLTLKKIQGKTVADHATATQAKGDHVFRTYMGANGIRQELLTTAAKFSKIAQVVNFGKTIQGKPMTAVRVTGDVQHANKAKRPVVVYQAAQHAREWITPETVRRFMHYVLDNYGKNKAITNIVNTTELWFIPVVNADGYDYTFTPGNRLWRKNLRDNNGDGKITSVDGVDPNRNFPYKWGYDNEGSSQRQASEVYRGKAPASEPETRAQLALYKRIHPTFLINYHSAAQLLLYGVGWQAYTPAPDDLVYRAIVGDKDHPAVKDYVPEISADLYTTNGETDDQVEASLGILAITPEESTCQTASMRDTTGQWNPKDCGSVFEFPDSEKLIQQEFQNNLNMMVDVAKSAHHPDNPVSPVGRTVPDFQTQPFSSAYGPSQTVRADIRRSLQDKRLNYRINGGRVHSVKVGEWKGGRRYGQDGTVYFAEYRGTVHAGPGAHVDAWFSGVENGRRTNSKHFDYRVRDQHGAKVLVIANEDIKGANPKYPSSVKGPKYAGEYTDTLKANGIKSTVWNFDTDGVPDPLAVLGHFKGIVWYRGDSRLTMDPADLITQIGTQKFADAQVPYRAAQLVYSIRDYLNEGGKLLYTGETSNYYGSLDNDLGGLLDGKRDQPAKTCVVTVDPSTDCELLSDDFSRYYLGVDNRNVRANPTGFTGTADPLTGISTTGFGGTAANPLNEAGVFDVTSTSLPPSQFPQFKSQASGTFVGGSAPGGGNAAVTTPNTVTLGFGLEQLSKPADRTALMGRIMNFLLH